MSQIDEHTVEPNIIVGPREQLFHLLAGASEIEHTQVLDFANAVYGMVLRLILQAVDVADRAPPKSRCPI